MTEDAGVICHRYSSILSIRCPKPSSWKSWMQSLDPALMAKTLGSSVGTDPLAFCSIWSSLYPRHPSFSPLLMEPDLREPTKRTR